MEGGGITCFGGLEVRFGLGWVGLAAEGGGR